MLGTGKNDRLNGRTGPGNRPLYQKPLLLALVSMLQVIGLPYAVFTYHKQLFVVQ